jgi:hypothetical protein
MREGRGGTARRSSDTCQVPGPFSQSMRKGVGHPFVPFKLRPKSTGGAYECTSDLPTLA